MNVEGEVKLNG